MGGILGVLYGYSVLEWSNIKMVDLPPCGSPSLGVSHDMEIVFGSKTVVSSPCWGQTLLPSVRALAGFTSTCALLSSFSIFVLLAST